METESTPVHRLFPGVLIVNTGRAMHVTVADHDWQAGITRLVLGWDRGGEDLTRTLSMDEQVEAVIGRGE